MSASLPSAMHGCTYTLTGYIFHGNLHNPQESKHHLFLVHQFVSETHKWGSTQHLTVLPTYHKQEKLKIPTSLYHPVIHKWHIWAANPSFYVPTQVIAVTARLLKAKQCCGLDNASSHEGRKGKERLGVGAKKWRRQMIVWVSQVNHCYHTCSLFVDFFFH